MRPQTPLSRIFFQKVIGVPDAPSADDDEQNADQEADENSEADGA